MSAGKGKRRLTREERALWTGVTRSVAPLRVSVDPDVDSSAIELPPPAQDPQAMRTGKAAAPPAKKPPPLAPLGRRLKQRVARGAEAIDARIDLHGFTQAQAHSALLHFLRRAQGNAAKLVLVITGKGARADDGSRERGVLRRQVPLWLRLPEFRDYVVGFEAAHPAHGGEGALYIRVRRGRARG
jgi:DNA-nicking Smr family endonuclease